MLSCNFSPKKIAILGFPTIGGNDAVPCMAFLANLHEAAVVSLQQQSEPEKMGISWGDSVEMPQMIGKKRGT